MLSAMAVRSICWNDRVLHANEVGTSRGGADLQDLWPGRGRAPARTPTGGRATSADVPQAEGASKPMRESRRERPTITAGIARHGKVESRVMISSRSPLYIWMRENFAELSAAFGKDRPNWTALVEAFSQAGCRRGLQASAAGDRPQDLADGQEGRWTIHAFAGPSLAGTAGAGWPKQAASRSGGRSPGRRNARAGEPVALRLLRPGRTRVKSPGRDEAARSG